MRLSWVAGAATLLLCGVAHAQQPASPPANAETTIGVGIICNTPDQAKHFIALQANGSRPREAMDAVNAEANDARACGVATIAFVRDRTVDTETVHDKLVEVVRINVIAGYNGAVWRPVGNMTQYAVMAAEGGESI
ncbi:MAG: hypothetical protein ACREB8_15290 [Pseudolabrys sp.]